MISEKRTVALWKSKIDGVHCTSADKVNNCACDAIGKTSFAMCPSKNSK